MRDKRPKSMIGSESEYVHLNLVLLQEACHMTNAQMAEVLGVELKYYERIKKTGKALDYGRLVRLYYNCGVDLNRLIANDPNVDIIRKTSNTEKPSNYSYKVQIDNLITDIKNSESQNERTEKIIETYLKFGKYLKGLLNGSVDE